LAGALVVCFAVAPAAMAAKKKGGGAVNITMPVNLPIPDAAPGLGGLDGVLNSTIEVGSKFKGRKVRDVNVTVQTLGVTGTSPVNDLDARLIAPNGAVTFLFTGLAGFGPTNLSIGPLTLDDEAALDLGDAAPVDPTNLYSPWAGTAQPDGNLWPFDNGPVRGTWTLNVYDETNGETSNLVSWHLNVVAGRPFQTK
jgi:hypothetical protein